jgi:Zn-dependent protease with chaperone function
MLGGIPRFAYYNLPIDFTFFLKIAEYHQALWWLGLTTLFAMLSWILFRAENVEQAFHMYARLGKLDKLTYLGLRENNYLVAFLVFIGMIITYWVSEFLIPKIVRYKWTFAVLEIVVFAVIILIDFVYLRPIKQFIYFQF